MTGNRLTVLTIVALTSGVGLGFMNSQARAKTYTTIPTALRGSWYHKNSDSSYDRVIFTKYHYEFPNDNGSWTNISGAKFPKYAMGHSQLSVSKKNSKGYYNIGSYASDEWPYWKRTTHNGSKALLMYQPMPPYSYIAEYYYPYSHYHKARHALSYYKTGFKKVVITKATKTTHYKYNLYGKLASQKAGSPLKVGQKVSIWRDGGQWYLKSSKYTAFSTDGYYANAKNSMTWFKDAR